MASEFDKLIGEWYEYQGYFVKLNLHLLNPKIKGIKSKRGFTTEADVLAVKLNPLEYLHIEGFWSTSGGKFMSEAFAKFKKSCGRYSDLFGVTSLKDELVRKIAIGRWAHVRDLSGTWTAEGMQIEYMTVPSIYAKIVETLSGKDPLYEVIPEEWPRLRAIQLSFEYGKSEKKGAGKVEMV